jgi:hypothetical protein
MNSRRFIVLAGIILGAALLIPLAIWLKPKSADERARDEAVAFRRNLLRISRVIDRPREQLDVSMRQAMLGNPEDLSATQRAYDALVQAHEQTKSELAAITVPEDKLAKDLLHAFQEQINDRHRLMSEAYSEALRIIADPRLSSVKKVEQAGAILREASARVEMGSLRVEVFELPFLKKYAIDGQSE